MIVITLLCAGYIKFLDESEMVKMIPTREIRSTKANSDAERSGNRTTNKQYTFKDH